MSDDIYETAGVIVTRYCGPSYGGTVTDRRRWQITLVEQADALSTVLRESVDNNRG